MRPEARGSSASHLETDSLISERDLPDWIRQIAADDARKLAETQEQASAAAATPGGGLPSHLGRRVLPGETLTSGPAPSSWLNRRDAVASAASSAWDVTGAAAPSRPVLPTADSTVVPVHSDVSTDVVLNKSTPAPAKRGLRRSAKRGADVVIAADAETQWEPQSAPAGGNPKQRLYLIAAAVVAVIFLLAMVFA